MSLDEFILACSCLIDDALLLGTSGNVLAN